jgi:hypothetical protein
MPAPTNGAGCGPAKRLGIGTSVPFILLGRHPVAVSVGSATWPVNWFAGCPPWRGAERSCWAWP